MGKRLQAAGVKRQLTIADLRARPDLRLRWPDFGRTTTLKVGAYCASVNSIPPGQQVYVRLGEMVETLYGSEGWGSSPSERDQVSGLSPGSGGAFLLTPLLTSACDRTFVRSLTRRSLAQSLALRERRTRSGPLPTQILSTDCSVSRRRPAQTTGEQRVLQAKVLCRRSPWVG